METGGAGQWQSERVGESVKRELVSRAERSGVGDARIEGEREREEATSPGALRYALPNRARKRAGSNGSVALT